MSNLMAMVQVFAMVHTVFYKIQCCKSSSMGLMSVLLTCFIFIHGCGKSLGATVGGTAKALHHKRPCNHEGDDDVSCKCVAAQVAQQGVVFLRQVERSYFFLLYTLHCQDRQGSGHPTLTFLKNHVFMGRCYARENLRPHIGKVYAVTVRQHYQNIFPIFVRLLTRNRQLQPR